MLFNSYIFIFGFLPITLAIFLFLSRVDKRACRIFLAIASLAFYGWWDWRNIPLLMGSILTNFVMGGVIYKSEGRRRHFQLVVGIVFNLGLLGFFKYTNFFIDTISGITGNEIEFYKILLPLGISFFSFTQIAFLVDVYRRIADEFDFANYLLFVTYFPHLIAGPVLHHKEMMPQFSSEKMGRPQSKDFAVGTAMFVIGLSKKVLVADKLAPFAGALFNGAAHGYAPFMFSAWAGVLAYTLQIYFDFSGYSDMAIGLSRLFGVRLPVNFNSPYKSTSLIEFWRRWHMTLSRFLRDYLYISLGGNRLGERRRQFNLVATMVLGGLWHGANWTFVIWGTIHGLLLSINHIWRNAWDGSPARTKRGKAAGWLLTMLVVVVAWVFFRADNVHVALQVLAGMVGIHGIILPESLGHALNPLTQHLPITFSSTKSMNLFSISENLHLGSSKDFFLWTGIALILLTLPNSQELLAKYSPVLETREGDEGVLRLTGWSGAVVGIVLAGLFCSCLINLNLKSEFLYFQF